MRIVLTALVVLVTPIICFCADTKSCMDAWHRNDWTRALHECKPLAEQGESDAQGVLAFMYYHGQGVAANKAEGVTWARKAVRQGGLPAPALAVLGVAYLGGNGVPRDLVQAHMWCSFWTAFPGLMGEEVRSLLKKISASMSAEQIAEATERYRDWTPGWECIYSLRTKSQPPTTAKSHSQADVQSCQEADERKDWPRAWRVCKPLAEHGASDAQIIVGDMYVLGQGVRQNVAEGISWHRKALRQGGFSFHTLAFLSTVYAKGNGVPQDLVEAYKWAYAEESESPGPFKAVASEQSKILSPILSAEQIEEAKERYRDWKAGWECLHSHGQPSK